MTNKITIIDYGMGNLYSVCNAVAAVGGEPVVTSDKYVIAAAEKIILPGVGAFGDCMANLHKSGLIPVIMEALHSGKPFLGICLGMQLMTALSTEGNVSTLGLMSGQTELIPDTGLPLPHMGWNRVHFDENCPLFDGIAQDSHFYFVHSYAVLPNENTIATSQHGVDFSAAIARNNFYGVQFHPERSGENGALLLKNFVEKVK